MKKAYLLTGLMAILVLCGGIYALNSNIIDFSINEDAAFVSNPTNKSIEDKIDSIDGYLENVAQDNVSTFNSISIISNSKNLNESSKSLKDVVEYRDGIPVIHSSLTRELLSAEDVGAIFYDENGVKYRYFIYTDEGQQGFEPVDDIVQEKGAGLSAEEYAWYESHNWFEIDNQHDINDQINVEVNSNQIENNPQIADASDINNDTH